MCAVHSILKLPETEQPGEVSKLQWAVPTKTVLHISALFFFSARFSFEPGAIVDEEAKPVLRRVRETYTETKQAAQERTPALNGCSDNVDCSYEPRRSQLSRDVVRM